MIRILPICLAATASILSTTSIVQSKGIPENSTVQVQIKGTWWNRKIDTFKNGGKKRHKAERYSETVQMRIFRVGKYILISRPDVQKNTVWQDGNTFTKGGTQAGIGRFQCSTFAMEEGPTNKECAKYTEQNNGFRIDIKNSSEFLGSRNTVYQINFSRGKCSVRKVTRSSYLKETEKNAYGVWPNNLRHTITKGSFRRSRIKCSLLDGKKPY